MSQILRPRMRRILVLALLIGSVGLLLWSTGVFGRGRGALPELSDGDVEFAWIHAATSGSTWERFVAGVLRAQADRPGLHVDDRRAFLDQTTAVPEIVISFDGVPGRMRIRWYKLTSETDNSYWVQRLAQRAQPPLAFIGGGTSERAVDLARALAAQTRWPGPPPLLLITTATANTLYADASAQLDAASTPTALMDVYRGRSFRFCFTNRQMAQAVVDFLWSQPDLRPIGDPMPALAAIGEPALDPWGAIGLMAVQNIDCPATATALEWDDDPYSIDLSRQFHDAFHQPGLPRLIVKDTRSIPYSVGGFYRPNAWEAAAAQWLLAGLSDAPLERQVLILPTSAAQARRVLRTVSGVRPLAGRSLVAVTGDSINVNNVFRDADLVWNSRALPIPVVFFAHQNPVAWDPTANLAPPNSTDDVLANRDLMRVLLEAAVVREGGASRLVRSADELAARLRGLQPPYFDAAGDRLGGRGEYIVVVRPQFSGGAPVLADAVLEVWTRGGPGPAGQWTQIERLVIDHGRRSVE